MSSLLQRQAGVAQATYSRDGVIEIEADPQAPFEVKKILSALKDEVGFHPIREVEVTLVGRIVATSKGWIATPAHGKDAFRLAENESFARLKAAPGIRDREVTLTGKLHVRRDGALVLTLKAFSAGASNR